MAEGRVSDFKPPLRSRPLVALGKLLFPLWLCKERLSISIQTSTDFSLSQIEGRRVVILPNHPDRQDALVACEMGRVMSGEFYAIAARELFDWDNGWRGRLYQRVGCYSVTRGKVDFESVTTTKRILSKGPVRLIAFPEAEITCDDEHVQEFQAGLFHLLLEINRSLEKTLTADEQILILPAGIRYEITSDVQRDVSPAMAQLCGILHIDETAGGFDAVLDAIIDRHLALMAELNRVSISPKQPHWQRVNSIISTLVNRQAQLLGIQLKFAPETDEARYQLRNELNRRKKQVLRLSTNTRLHADQQSLYTQLALMLDTLERWSILAKALEKPRSPQRVLQIIDYIQVDLCGEMTPKSDQRAKVLLGNPIEVHEYMSKYSGNPEQAVASLTQSVQEAMQQLLLAPISDPTYIPSAA